jgi:hypothetical protein
MPRTTRELLDIMSNHADSEEAVATVAAAADWVAVARSSADCLAASRVVRVDASLATAAAAAT